MDERMWVTASALVVLACAVLTAIAIPAAARAAPRRTLIPVIAGEVLVLSVAAPVLAGFVGAPGAVTEAIAQLFFPAFALLAATFPDGRFVPRGTLALVIATTAVTVANWIAGGWLSEQPWWWVVPTANLLFVAAQVWRYRRSSTTLERERVRWVLLGLLVCIPIYAVLMVVDAGVAGTGPASEARANLAILPILLGLAVGMGRPRLVNVDTPLRIVLAGWFAAFGLVPVFWGAAALTGALGVDAVSAGWWWALAVAAVAYPVVRLAIRLADLVVHRGRASPASAVALLGDRLAAEPDPSEVAATVAGVARDVVRSRGVALAVGAEVTAIGDDAATADAFAIEFQGEHLAVLRVLPRAGESELVRRDRDALAAIARHAGPALSAARRAGELSVAHSRLVVAREEERRRLRRDLHDDLAPTLSGISLGAAALSRSLAPTDPAHADRARDLHDDVQSAVLQARQIAYGLRPAVLDDLGLVAAIRDRVLTPDDPGVVVEVVGDDLPAALPAAVDVAALRIVQEAVANVRRHAAATRCRVDLRVVGDDLVVTITDDGTGMPARYRPGMGLTSIRERATELGGQARISAASGGGTVVTVRLPTAAELSDAEAVA